MEKDPDVGLPTIHATPPQDLRTAGLIGAHDDREATSTALPPKGDWEKK